MAPVSSRAPLSAKDAPTRAVSDSQRTISDQLGHLDLGDVNRTEHPKSPLTETAEERLRIIKGKAHITDTPTSRDREPRARSSSVIIRDPENRHQTHQHTISPRSEASSPGHKNNVPKQLDLDIDLDLGQDPEITLTEDELALVDSMVMETERLEMDAKMLDKMISLMRFQTTTRKRSMPSHNFLQIMLRLQMNCRKISRWLHSLRLHLKQKMLSPRLRT
ncbi:unnamed protein product [Brassica oleracea]